MTSIEDAKKLIGSQEQSFEDVISGLETERIRIEKEKEEIAYKIANNETLKHEYALEKENVKKALEKAEEELNEKHGGLPHQGIVLRVLV